jgi:hypothetical protein
VFADGNSLLSPVTDTVKDTVEQTEEVTKKVTDKDNKSSQNQEQQNGEKSASSQEKPKSTITKQVVNTAVDTVDEVVGEVEDTTSDTVDQVVGDVEDTADIDINAHINVSDNPSLEVNTDVADVNVPDTPTPSSKNVNREDRSQVEEKSSINQLEKHKKLIPNDLPSDGFDEDKNPVDQPKIHLKKNETGSDKEQITEKSIPVEEKRNHFPLFFNGVIPSANQGPGLNGPQNSSIPHGGSGTGLYAVLFSELTLSEMSQVSKLGGHAQFYYDQWVNAPPSPPPETAPSL